MLPDFGRLGVEVDEAVGDRSAVQVDVLGDTLGDPIGCARNHDPRVAVAEEHDAVEVLELDEVDHVGYVGVEVDFGACEVHPFAQAGEGEGVGVVPLLSESAGYGLPAPAPEPSTTDQHVRSHPKDLLLSELPSATIVSCRLRSQGGYSRTFGEEVFSELGLAPEEQ